jgi:hypothetical protein
VPGLSFGCAVGNSRGQWGMSEGISEGGGGGGGEAV